MRPRPLCFLIVTLFGLATTARMEPLLGQEGQPETIEQALQRHHIALTREALIAGLRNPDAEARRLSAHKLAQDGDKGAVPAIMSALKSEPLPLNRVNLAFSLAQLGAKVGTSTLRTSCSSPDIPADLRMIAAQYMQWLHNDDCRASVMQMLSLTGDDPRVKEQALSLVPGMRTASTGDYELLFEATTALLKDEDSGVRMSASSILGRLGDASAVPYLEQALATERDNGCVLVMQEDLRRLRRPERHE